MGQHRAEAAQGWEAVEEQNAAEAEMVATAAGSRCGTGGCSGGSTREGAEDSGFSLRECSRAAAKDAAEALRRKQRRGRCSL